MKTRKLLALVLSALMVLGAIPFTAISAAEPAEQRPIGTPQDNVEPQLTSDAVVYVADYGYDSNDGASDTPVATLTRAYELLGTAGGTIVVCGNVDITNEPLDTYEYTAEGAETAQTLVDGRYKAPAHTGLVKITSIYEGDDYAGLNSACLTFGTWSDNGSDKSHHYIIGGPTTFENITINASTNPVFYGRGHFITMGEGISNTVAMLVVGYDQGTGVSDPYQSATDTDTHIIIKSGKYNTVAGMTRNANNGAYTGTAYITVEGNPEIDTLAGISVSANGGHYGNAVIEINGGTYKYLSGAANKSTNGVYGNVYMVINDMTNSSGRTDGVTYASTGGTFGDVTVEINGGSFNTYDAYTYDGKTGSFGNSTLTINGGTFKYVNGVSMGAASSTNAGHVGFANTVVNDATISNYLYGGSFRGTYTADRVALTINGGTYSAGVGTLNNAGTATVNDCTEFNVTAGIFSKTVYAVTAGGTVKGGFDAYINISGGTFNNASSMALSNVAISGIKRVYYNISGGNITKLYVGSASSSGKVIGGGMYFTYSGGSIGTLSTAWITGYQKYYFIGEKTRATTNISGGTGGVDGWPIDGDNGFNYVDLPTYPTEVYYKSEADGGDYVNNGLTADAPVQSIYDAAATLGPNGGTIYLLSNVAGFESPKCEGTLTFSAVLPGTTEPNGKGINFGSSNVYLQSDVVFDGLTLTSTARENLIAMQGHDLQINENVTTVLGTDGALGLVAGYSIADTAYASGGKGATELSLTGDQTITVNGGTYNYFFGGNRRWGQNATVGTYSGNMTVNIGAGATFTADYRADDVNPTFAFYLTGMNIVKGSVTANLNGTFDLPVFAFGKLGVYNNGESGTDGVYIWQDTKNEVDITVNAAGNFTLADGYIKGVAQAGDTPVWGTFTLNTTGAAFADNFTIDAKGYLEATTYTGVDTVAVKNFTTVNGAANLSDEPIRVITVGDSITWGTCAVNELVNGYTYNSYNYNYPSQLGKLLGQGAVIGNYGYPGSHAFYSHSKNYYGSSAYGMSLQFGEADAVVLALGINDHSHVATDGVADPEGVENYLAAMRDLIETYHAAYPTATIYITTTLPAWNGDVIGANQTNVVIPLQRQLAGEYEYTEIIDLYTAMLPYAEIDQTNNTTTYFADKLHPTNLGYGLMAEAVANDLTQDLHYYEHTHIDVECEVDGCDSYTCLFCGDNRRENVVAAPGHDLYETGRLDATTTAEGYIDWACRNCDYTNHEILPIVGLTYSRSEVVAPTCTEQGYTRHYCDQDETYYDDTFVAPLGHDLSTVTVDAVCGVAGSITTTCSRCDYREVEAIPALEHVPGDAATCTTVQKCTLCGEVLAQALGHNYQVSETVNATAHLAGHVTKTCTRCSSSVTTWTDATDGIVVFVDTKNGTAAGDGSLETPFNTYTKALQYANTSFDRTIVLMSMVTVSGSYTETVHAGHYTITSFYNGIKYDGGLKFTSTGSPSYSMNGQDTFENLTINVAKTLVLQARHNKIVMGNDITYVGPSTGLYIVGGVNSNKDDKFNGKATDITILSGKYHMVVGGNRTTAQAAITEGINIYIGGTAEINILALSSMGITGFATTGPINAVLDGGVINQFVASFESSTEANCEKTAPKGDVILTITENFDLENSFNTAPASNYVSGLVLSNARKSLVVEGLNAMPGNVEIRIHESVYAEYSASEKIDVAGCKSIVSYADAVEGDFDGDGELTNADITVLIRYLSGWTVDAEITDLTGDGKINNRDAIALIVKISEADT